jgi:hypothetical protein
MVCVWWYLCIHTYARLFSSHLSCVYIHICIHTCTCIYAGSIIMIREPTDSTTNISNTNSSASTSSSSGISMINPGEIASTEEYAVSFQDMNDCAIVW